jgi:hypothetical protein
MVLTTGRCPLLTVSGTPHRPWRAAREACRRESRYRPSAGKPPQKPVGRAGRPPGRLWRPCGPSGSCRPYRSASRPLARSDTPVDGWRLANCYIYGPWRAGNDRRVMGAFNGYCVMSALPLKADMCGALAHVCFGPKANIGSYLMHSAASRRRGGSNLWVRRRPIILRCRVEPILRCFFFSCLLVTP